MAPVSADDHHERARRYRRMASQFTDKRTVKHLQDAADEADRQGDATAPDAAPDGKSTDR